ncbi:MAG: nuclear transport factor 2 family protein [Bryobacteraceae bacterium]|nr:nuclear transport factor 2 family protein [Bryobacteraceae bacterium]
MSSYFLIRYKPGTAWPPGTPFRDLDMAAHAAYVERLFHDGVVVLAGPLRDDQGGFMVIQAEDPAQAAAVIAADPAVTAGLFIGEANPWRPVYDATRSLGRSPAHSRFHSVRSFEAWLDGYKNAWERRDPAAAAALFCSEATYRETPFDEPMRGIDAIVAYWSEAPLTQRDIRFEYEILSAEPGAGVARWRAAFTRVPSGVHVQLDGTLYARFDAGGRCVSFEEWWVRREDPQPPAL